jgi:hypothetical protein
MHDRTTTAGTDGSKTPRREDPARTEVAKSSGTVANARGRARRSTAPGRER